MGMISWFRFILWKAAKYILLCMRERGGAMSGDAAAGEELILRYTVAITAYLEGFLHNARDTEDLILSSVEGGAGFINA